MSARKSRGDATEKDLSPDERQAKMNELERLMGPIVDKLPVDDAYKLESSFGWKNPVDISQRRMEMSGKGGRYMGSAMKIVFDLKKFAVISMRTCYRSVRNYPYLFALLCVLILLYRSCPFLFSLLVSASPVLICTAALLGTLLSFGQPNIPEIETEEKVSRDVAFFGSEILDNATVVAKEDDSFTVERFEAKEDDSFTVERFVAKEDNSFTGERFEGNQVGNSYVERGSEEERKTSMLDEHAGFVGLVPVINEHNREIQFEKGSVEEFEKGELEKAATEREFSSSELEERREIYEKDLDVKSLTTDGENVVENQLLAAESTGNEVFEVEDHNISIELAHKGDQLSLSLSDKDDHVENDYNSLRSESDRAESSSPDASMTDIIPLLDELHPLLDSETPQPAQGSNEESDADSELYHKSDGECVMSDDEAENQGEECGVVEDDEDDEDDDDEGMQEEKEDESKSAIKWTEDDQKNLMDLGSLELERNQRLENLIARRRARNNLRMLAGMNLLDLDGFDLPGNVPPISTTRRNPFDLPYDSYNNMGLPPIPGSAPSILLPRRNPFDLPYDPNEEKPDLKSDDFEHEFLPPQQKDMFRRHESFSVGPSNFSIPKLEQQNIRWKPYFMPEKVAAEETNYSPLERQLSEASESKLSCVSDTESMSSIADQDDKKPDESHSFLETTAVSFLDPIASVIEHGNGPWEDIGSENYVQENRHVHHEVIEITLGSTESHFESQSGSSEIGAADIPVEINASEIHSKNVLVETDISSHSSLSSLSEVNETSIEVKTDEAKPNSPQPEESSIDTTSITMSTAFEKDADFKIVSEVLDDNQHNEPVYDSSPSAEGKESEVQSEIEQDITSSLEDTHDDSSELHIVDKNEQESREVPEVIVHEITKVESPKHGTNYDAQNLTVAHELLVEHVPIDSGPSFSDIASIEKGIVNDVVEDKDQLTSHEENIIEDIHKIEDENLNSSPSSDQISSRSRPTFTEPEEQLSSAINHVSAEIESSSNENHVEFHETLNDKENSELEQTKICRSSSSGSSSVEEVILQTDVICHSDQPTTSTSNHGSEIPAQDINDLVETTDSLATLSDHLITANATIPGPQEQKNPPVVEEEAVLISVSSTFPSGLEQVEERSMNEDEFVRSEQDIVELSSVKSHTESESLQDLGIKIASSGSSTPNMAPEVISSVTELEQSWSDKSMVEPILGNREDVEEQGVLSIDSAAEVISENVTPKVHQDISTALSSVEADSSTCSPVRSPNTGRNPKDDIVDLVVSEDREEVSKHLDYLAETHGSRFSEKMIREEVNEITDIDEGLLVELDEVGDFSGKKVGEPILEEKVLPEEAQAERFELGSNSNPTEAKSDIPMLEAKSLYDINLAFRQLHEGVDVEDVILPSAIESESQINELNPEASSDLEVVEARSLGDIHDALTQVSKNNMDESSSSTKNLEAKSDIPMLEAKSLDDINLAFRQLHEGVGVENVILPSAIESQINELNPEASSDLEVVEARSLGDIHDALTQVSKNNMDESSSSTKNLEAKSDIPMLEAKSLDDINLAFRQLHEGVSVEDVILPSAIESQINELNPEASSDLEVVEVSSLGDIHDALTQVSKNSIGESSSSSNNLETKSDIPMLEAKLLDDTNLAFRQLHEGVDVEDVILPSAVKSQVTEEAIPEKSSDLEVVEARSLGDIHVASMQLSENNIGESGSSSNPTETKSDIPILEARSLDDINLASRQLHEAVDVEDVILPSTVENQVKEEAKAETSSDLEVVEAKSLGDIHATLMEASEKNLNELPTSSVSNDPSEGGLVSNDPSEGGLEPYGADSNIETVPSNTTNVDKPADIVDEKSVDSNVSASKTKDKKAKSRKSKSGSSSSSSSSSSDSD